MSFELIFDNFGQRIHDQCFGEESLLQEGILQRGWWTWTDFLLETYQFWRSWPFFPVENEGCWSFCGYYWWSILLKGNIEVHGSIHQGHCLEKKSLILLQGHPWNIKIVKSKQNSKKHRGSGTGGKYSRLCAGWSEKCKNNYWQLMGMHVLIFGGGDICES